MPDRISRRERLAIIALVGACWALGYFGTGLLNVGRAARALPWDPVVAFPVVSAFVIPYVSAFVLPFLAAVALRDRREFRRFAAVFVGTVGVCAAFFLLMPLTIHRPEVAGTGLFDRMLAALYASDRPGNLFPSLHVALSFLCAAAIGHARPRWRRWALAWATVIAASTLLTRQHYLVDVIAGIVVAWSAWKIFLRR